LTTPPSLSRVVVWDLPFYTLYDRDVVGDEVVRKWIRKSLQDTVTQGQKYLFDVMRRAAAPYEGYDRFIKN